MSAARSGAALPRAATGSVPARTDVAPSFATRSSVHRLTMPGSLLLLVIVATQVGVGNGRVDAQLLALVVVALIVLLVVGVLIPVITVRRVRVAVSCPADAVVGREVPVEITLAGRSDRLSVRVLDPRSDWFHTAVPVIGTISHRAERRGVFPHVDVEVRCTWPLGLCTFARVHTVALARPIRVAPWPAPVQAEPGPVPAEDSHDHRPAPMVSAAGDAVRAVRPYVHGDPPRLVHWPTSARAGTIVVRELEPPARTGLVVVVDLRPPSPDPTSPSEGSGVGAMADRIERAASHGMGLVTSALRSGAEVVLSTCEPGGPVIAPVPTVAAAGRRLAAAVSGEPAPPLPGWVVETVRP